MQDNRLWQLLTSPQQVYEQPSEKDWLEVERKFGILPEDYKKFLADYGTGRIGDFIWIFNPVSQNDNLNLIKQIHKQLDSLQSSAFTGFSMHAGDGGIMPFGISDNGDLLAWLVQGEADSWRIIVFDSRSPDYQVFDMGFSSFLTRILKRELECTIFPSDFPNNNPVFISAADLNC